MKKKFVIALLTCILSVSAVACGNTTDTKDSKAKQTTESKKEIKKDTAERDDSPNDKMSQAEWIANGGADNMEDGYEKVDSVNITSSTTSLKYTNSKIVDDTATDGTVSTKILIYFDFSNINDSETDVESHYNFSVYQNGVQLDQWITMSNSDFSDDSFDNAGKNILSGTTNNIAVAFELSDTTSPIKVRVDNSLDDDGETQIFAQQQEINLQ